MYYLVESLNRYNYSKCLQFRSTLGAPATITRLKIAISRPCARSARFARASLRKMKVQIEAQERSRVEKTRSSRLRCNAVAPISRDSRVVSAATSCFLLQRIRDIRFRLGVLSSGRTYMRTYERMRFPAHLLRLALSRAYRDCQAESLRSIAQIPVELHIIIISHVIENTESPTRIYFYGKHLAGRYYVK